MIVNQTHKFLMIHVPKSAGTALKNYLSRFTAYRDIEIGGSTNAETISTYYRSRFGLTKHSTGSEIRSIIGNDDFTSLIKFAFVRNPFSRSLSIFRFLKYTWRNWEGSEIMDSFANFEEFALSDFYQTSGPDRILEPQAFWVCDADGQPLTDFIGKNEAIDQDLQRLCERIGLPSPGEQLRHRNVSLGGSRPLDEVFNDRLIKQKTLDRYAEDFATFGYSSEL